MKTNNVGFFVGENPQYSRQELVAFAGKKQCNNNPFFAGGWNDKVDPITLKKQMAQKKAMKVVGDAFAADRKLDTEMADREAKIKEMRDEILEARNALKELDTQKAEIGKVYGLGEEGLSEEDWKLLDKGYKAPGHLTDDERARYQDMKEQGLTEYYSRCKDIDNLAEPYRQTIDDNTGTIKEFEAANKAIHKGRLDLRKGNPMIAAQEEAEAIMDAARAEIIDMIKDEGMDHIDEEMQEKVEKAQEEKEKKEAEEEKLEAIREDREQIQNQAEAARERAHENEKRAEELMEALPTEELLQMNNGTSDFQQELKDIMYKMKLMAEDLKGAAVDATL